MIDSIFKIVFTPEWFANNIGTILGSIVGTILAYLLGAYQTRKQIELTQFPERLREARKELPFLKQLENDFGPLMEELEQSCMEEKIEKKTYKKLWAMKESYWEILTNSKISNSLDSLLTFVEMNLNKLGVTDESKNARDQK